MATPRIPLKVVQQQARQALDRVRRPQRALRQSASSPRVPETPAGVGEPIPAVCTITDLARVMRISRCTADRRFKFGLLKAFELPSFGGHPRFSGKALLAWRDQDTTAHINGQVDRRRSFGRGSRSA